jgi:hypothetical protein
VQAPPETCPHHSGVAANSLPKPLVFPSIREFALVEYFTTEYTLKKSYMLMAYNRIRYGAKGDL